MPSGVDGAGLARLLPSFEGVDVVARHPAAEVVGPVRVDLLVGGVARVEVYSVRSSRIQGCVLVVRIDVVAAPLLVAADDIDEDELEAIKRSVGSD